ncbi:hypothetical protein DB330_12750 [Lacticaseibacillus casei]|uniref:Hypothetical phage protein n=1 Tax=Lacticaseibacillus casei DSM 20011 = JCM 1134 = ATCC 393 TaxID=1423732 RepID=A0AAD1APE1_LACCA|nr:hypothetical protein [Lacticaseibacillus casei]MED7631461.1 hypothetical protein [Lacticaseibacillus casei]PTU91288.1 hypothetical protein DB330_12750 [Lacticaseibacillus casei]TLF31185.1 hypothetical protein FEI10_11760 [Lacticaseibacillus casei]TLF32842.1 hypothetical protein FEI12_11605 [Lacticaseibacillus casei]BAN73815.1 hypothetical phage protein [Lacticaseibacillus casei DSM 20011 = JCM 1134 = ATCC 393]
MRIGINRFMSWIGFTLAVVASFMPEKHLAYGHYKTFVCLALGAILFALWDIADVIREARE